MINVRKERTISNDLKKEGPDTIRRISGGKLILSEGE